MRPRRLNLRRHPDLVLKGIREMHLSEMSPPQAASAVRAPSHGPARARLLNWRYVACVVALAAFAVGIRVYSDQARLFFQKQAVPLQQPLAAFDFRKLEPRYSRPPRQPERLSQDVEQSLGTSEYMVALLEDREAPEKNRTRNIVLFISYYTGKPDQVPHIADDCFAAANYEQVSAENRRVDVPGIGPDGGDLKVPIRILRFRPKLARGPEDGERTVIYFFHTNGLFCTTREEVRVAQMDLVQRYAYYAKVEIAFGDAGVEDAVRAVVPLLQQVLPIFLNEHLDWQRVSNRGRSDHAP